MKGLGISHDAQSLNIFFELLAREWQAAHFPSLSDIEVQANADSFENFVSDWRCFVFHGFKVSREA